MCGLVALLCLAVGVAGAADPPGTPASREALELCHRADDAPEGERAALLDRALAQAERAVVADDGDALAHFAVFCSVGALAELRRLRREIDRTLELAPDFADALAGKGALLLDAPRLLGGDPKDAERQLRRALEIDPDYLGPRLDLARALRARGAKDEAHAEAERALEIARRKNDADGIKRAEALLADGRAR